jgi:hypothetical protein
MRICAGWDVISGHQRIFIRGIVTSNWRDGKRALMFVRASVIRCKKCFRLFSDYANFCPECGERTKRGWITVLIPVIAMILTTAAILWALLMLGVAD